jgi:hypothetical protein
MPILVEPTKEERSAIEELRRRGELNDIYTGESSLLQLPPPQDGPQREFCETLADIAVYGGAAGGGKTWSLLRDAARHVDNPRYRATIFRRTSPQITNPGGLWDAAEKLYPLLGAKGFSDSEWRFRSGAEITFKHLQHARTVHDWQGSEVSWIGFDELTHFLEEQFFYLFSRNRSDTGIAGKIRATTNPAPGWVKSFLKPWLDKEYDNPAQSGELRWFVRENGEVRWVSGDYRDADGDGPVSVTFIRSSVYDNPYLLEKDPGYIKMLKSLPLVEQARLLHGDWDVFEGSFFEEWSESIHTATPLFRPDQGLPRDWCFFGGLDWGYADPFAFTFNGVDRCGTIHGIESIQRTRLTNEGQAALIVAMLSKWGVDPRAVLIGYDPSMNSQKTINGVRGEADIEAFHRAGLTCVASKADPQHGNNLIREILHTPRRYKVWKGYNADLIRLFPIAQYDKADPEAMAHDSASHLLASLRYGLSTRPHTFDAVESVNRDDQLPEQLRPEPKTHEMFTDVGGYFNNEEYYE